MRLRLTRSIALASSSHGGDGEWTRGCWTTRWWWPCQRWCKKPLSEADKQKEADVAKIASLARWAMAPTSPSPTITEEIGEMLRLSFTQRMAMKLVDDQGIDSPWTLASLSDNKIANICDMIRRHSRFETPLLYLWDFLSLALSLFTNMLMSIFLAQCSGAFVGKVSLASL